VAARHSIVAIGKDNGVTSLFRLLGIYFALIALALRAPAQIGSCLYRPVEPVHVVSNEIEQLLKPIALTADWKDVPVSTQKRLEELADQRLAAFRNAWDFKALSDKEHILLHCPTVAMSTNEDRYYRQAYINIVPATFI
jgi:hypothetical protein